MQGHIYDLQAHKAPDQYIRTTHKITNYIWRIHKKHTAIFVKAMEALQLDMPLDPMTQTRQVQWQWKGGRSSSRGTMRRPMPIMTSLHTSTTLPWDNALWDWRNTSSHMLTMSLHPTMACPTMNHQTTHLLI